MKRMATALAVSVLAAALGTGLAIAKPAYKSALGAEKCDTCHVEGQPKSTANTGNPTWVKAKDMAAKMKEAKGDFAGKTSCNDCHKGKMKP